MSDDEYSVSSREEKDEDIYDDEYIETLEEDDEISPEEEAFMKGYKKAGQADDEDEEE